MFVSCSNVLACRLVSNDNTVFFWSVAFEQKRPTTPNPIVVQCKVPLCKLGHYTLAVCTGTLKALS